jgi:hypothetical protein
LQFLAVSCSPTAFFKHLYTSEQGSFSGSRLRTNASSSQPRTRRQHKAWGASPRNRRCGIVPPPSPPHIPKHRFLRQLRSFPFDARYCISREHLVKPEVHMNLHHSIRSHNWLRAEPADGRLGLIVTFLGYKSLAGCYFWFRQRDFFRPNGHYFPDATLGGEKSAIPRPRVRLTIEARSALPLPKGQVRGRTL